MGDRYAVERAIKQSGLPSPSRLILYTLLTHVTNGTLVVPSEYTPSLTRLAEETGLSRRAVADHLNIVEAEGWLTRFRPSASKARSEKARTSYRITIPAALSAGAPDALVQEAHQTPASAGDALAEREPQVTTSAGDALVQEVHRASAGGAHNPTSSPTSSSPTEKKGGVGGGKRTKASGEHPAFAEWYAAYPAHKARGAAVKAYAKAAGKTDPATLLAAARRYRADPQVARGYAKHPATWLNQECWLDEPAPLQATGTEGTYGHGPRARVNDHDWTQGGPTV